MAGYVPTSDWKRNKLRERLLTKGPFPELIDFSRPFVVVSAKAMREGMGTYRPHVPLEMKTAAGWPARHLPGLVLDSLDDLLPIQATPEERERFDRGEPILVRMSVCGMRAEQPSGGQPTDDIEKRIKNAFAVNVFVIFERLRYLVPLRDGKISATGRIRGRRRTSSSTKSCCRFPGPRMIIARPTSGGAT